MIKHFAHYNCHVQFYATFKTETSDTHNFLSHTVSSIYPVFYTSLGRLVYNGSYIHGPYTF